MIKKIRDRVVANIEEYGWSITGVVSDDPLERFSYSTGAALLGKPELIVTALGAETSARIINTLLELKEPLQQDVPYLEIVNWPLILKKVSYSDEIKQFMTLTSSYYETLPFEVFQVVFPDPNGLFPWETGYFCQPQRLLYDGAPDDSEEVDGDFSIS